VSASGGRLVGETAGEIELEGNVLVIKRIHVRLRLRAPEAQRAVAEKVLGIFAAACPVYRSLHPQIAISTELLFEAEEGSAP
jgi:hypothetical protein